MRQPNSTLKRFRPHCELVGGVAESVSVNKAEQGSYCSIIYYASSIASIVGATTEVSTTGATTAKKALKIRLENSGN
jgi:hypothetical protein